MRRVFARFAGLLVVALIVAGCALMPGRGWVTLIDGDKGMENWNPTGSNANWRAEGGAIQADKTTGKGSSVLVSKQSFKDFDLYVEFWAGEQTNSGIFIRIMNPTNVSTSTGAYEAQIWDRNPNTAFSTGSLAGGVAGVSPIYKAGGRWNTYEIHAKGPEITVKLNGVVTVSAHDGRFPEGRLGIQFNNGPIKVRKMLVREL
jgi:3-keto-disaccharide hydrolase